jgi:hypothetical protein
MVQSRGDFFGTPAQEFCSMPKSSAGEVIELHLHGQLVQPTHATPIEFPGSI